MDRGYESINTSGSGRNYTSLCTYDIHAGGPTISIPMDVHVGSLVALIDA
jgi:hypothetical protein